MVLAGLSKLMIIAVAATGLSIPVVMVSTPLASALPVTQSPCSPGVAPTAPADFSPSPSCTSDKEQCMSANVQEGIYGERYVPPDAVAMCMDAYRDCVNANSGTDAVG